MAAMQYNYIGAELDVFAHAKNWKRYLARRITPFLKGDVLEVGSGIGSVTQTFNDGTARRWVCLEPDPELSRRAQSEGAEFSSNCEFVIGTVVDLPHDALFDAIIYIDVLEHIEDDHGELLASSKHLKRGGVICVLAPAHNALYTEFDRAIGHFRRYNKRMLSAAGPPRLKLERLEYLDSCGLLVSMANRFFLRSDSPTAQQVIFWDRTLVRASLVIDPLIGRTAGKSISAVWRKID